MRACSIYVVLMVFAALLATGCAGKTKKSKSVILQHPQTMEFVKCDVGQWGSEARFRNNRECLEAYRQQGYVVWGEH